MRNCVYKGSVAAKIWLFFAIMLTPFMQVTGQDKIENKISLQPGDYHLWGSLEMDQISYNGDWVSFYMRYTDKSDTLFVRNQKNGKTHYFPEGSSGAFGGTSFGCLLPDGRIAVTDLRNGKQQVIEEAKSFWFTSPGNALVVLKRKNEQGDELILQQPDGKLQKSWTGVKQVFAGPTNNSLAFVRANQQGNTLLLLQFDGGVRETVVEVSSRSKYVSFEWEANEGSLAFCRESEDANEKSVVVGHYDVKSTHLDTFDIGSMLPAGHAFVTNGSSRLRVAPGGHRIFFGVENKGLTPLKDEIEIWNTNDKWVHPTEKRIAGWERKPKVWMWTPKKKQIVAITTNELPQLMLSGLQDYAILSNEQAYEPQKLFYGERDYYLMDLSTGLKELWLQKGSGSSHNMISSADGKFISYPSSVDYWVYDLENRRHTNVSQNLRKNREVAIESPGWTTDNHLIILDGTDVWLVDPVGGDTKRLTDGNAKGLQFSLAQRLRTSLFDGNEAASFDPDNLLLSGSRHSTGTQTFFHYSNKSGLRALGSDEGYSQQLVQSGDMKVFAYLFQRFDLPPQLRVAKRNGTPKVLYQSNEHHFNYHWGKSDMITYKDHNSAERCAALYYPAQFDPSRQYPLVVQIYEDLSHERHFYTNPSFSNGAGFNVTNFTVDGYFVLKPEISYRTDAPGISAAESVVGATQAAIERGFIDKSRIGLIGHSFGGYETAFIVTQTNLFAAAVAGAGIMNVSSFYHSVAANNGRPEGWRFEYSQWRMSKPYHEAVAQYDMNSTIPNAHKINIPLLLWSGKNDMQVRPEQSIELHLALRRMQKPSILVLYPGETHVISKPQNSLDLTTKIADWFNYYLKNEQPAGWMQKMLGD